MPRTARRPAVPLVIALAAALAAGCGGPSPSTPGDATPAASGTVATPSVPATTPGDGSPQVELTPVPGAGSGGPVDPGRPPVTIVTDWGRIVDGVPEDFPVYPGADPADGIDEPVSGAWIAGDDVETVAGWYVGAFEDREWAMVDLGSALEDGTRVLDLASDLPECRVQATFRPADGSTMILVLYGAGCAGADG